MSWWATRKEAWQAWLRGWSGTLFWGGCELGSRVLVHARSVCLREVDLKVTIALDFALLDDPLDNVVLLPEASLDNDQN